MLVGSGRAKTDPHDGSQRLVFDNCRPGVRGLLQSQGFLGDEHGWSESVRDVGESDH